MISKDYFFIQQLSFKLCGIDIKATNNKSIIKRPGLCYIPLICAILHITAMLHYVYVHRHDFSEVTEALAVVCQSSLAISKMLIFFVKRMAFLDIINNITLFNSKACSQELPKIVSENNKDIKMSNIYFKSVVGSGIIAFAGPIFEAIYFYLQKGKLVLRVPFKASYAWNHSNLPGYSLVYLWNLLSIYNLICISMAIDTLFIWLVSNISAQFHILCFRLKEAGKICSATTSVEATEAKKSLSAIKSCIAYHNQTLKLAADLNKVYGEILFIKFLFSCLQVCCLVFRVSRATGSVGATVHQGLFLIAVALQLMLYCFNGQKIRDESLQVAPEIYFAFDWSNLSKSCKNLLLVAMIRSQRSCQLSGGFFVIDLTLFLWAFKTAGSLVAALKTLDENQE